MKRNEKTNFTIAFTGGGTGGHVYPALAVLDECRHLIGESFTPVWIGSVEGIERSIVENKGIPYRGIPAGKLRRYFSLQNMFDIFKIAIGFISAVIILRRIHPALLFSKGGYVSVPPVLAAKVLGIPVFSHDSDFSPGLATRINTNFSEKIFVAYPETKTRYFSGSDKVVVSGNPVRQDIFSGDRAAGMEHIGYPSGDEVPVILFLGGSLGARQINDVLNGCIDELLEFSFVVHQTGDSGIPLRSHPRYFQANFFSDELPHILAAADVVVSRSGASTIWENAALGKPAVLIPLGRGSSRGDQIMNAEYFREKGAAVVIEHGDDSKELLSMIKLVTGDEKRQSTMSGAARMIGEMPKARAHGGNVCPFGASALIAQFIIRRTVEGR